MDYIYAILVICAILATISLVAIAIGLACIEDILKEIRRRL